MHYLSIYLCFILWIKTFLDIVSNKWKEKELRKWVRWFKLWPLNFYNYLSDTRLFFRILAWEISFFLFLNFREEFDLQSEYKINQDTHFVSIMSVKKSLSRKMKYNTSQN